MADNWSQEQLANAAVIYQVGKRMGASQRDIQIALATAVVESNLLNVKYGDRDSLGLFQQRPSQGWGTAQQVLDPTYAAGKFFKSLMGLGESRLHMSMGAAAQAVQRSAYPGRYDQKMADVRALFPRVQAAAGDPQLDMDGKTYGAPDPLTGQVSPDQTPTDDLTWSTADAVGAWEMPDFSQDDTGALPMPMIGEGTNQSYIVPLAQSKGGYDKGIDNWRKAVVEMAKEYVGTPYIWGGTSPDGFDCSGLVQYVFGKVGKDMPRISFQQANSGTRTKLSNLKPGDLVAWDNSSRNNGADHIAIYIGNGMIVEAPRPGLSVRIRSLGKDEGAFGVSLN